MGSLIYVVEGPENGFTSIPLSIYWAVTTMTTVGYGDLTPQSALGQLLTTVMMLVGWGTLAVPTGIVTTEIALHRRNTGDGDPLAALLQADEGDPHPCPACGERSHPPGAAFCHKCGTALSPQT
jgi:voltage-gated potassium channel